MVALAAAVPLVVGLEVSLPVAFSWAWVLWALPAALPPVLWQLPLPLWAFAGQCASPGDVTLPLGAPRRWDKLACNPSPMGNGIVNSG